MIAIPSGSESTAPPSINEYKGQSLYEWVNNYVVVDIETTGYVLHRDKITELAAVKVVNGMIVSEFQSLVKPGIPISEGITRLNGITNEMVDTAPTISKILPHKLKYLVKRFGIANEVEHRGLPDAKNTQKCYEYMKRYAANNPKIVGSYSPHNALEAKAKVSNNNYINETTPVYGKTFVFTGDLERMSRKDAMQLVNDMGGACNERVTFKTNYLVLGDNNDNPLVKNGISGKQEKAEKYKAAGRNIEIISEDVFYNMVLENKQAG